MNTAISRMLSDFEHMANQFIGFDSILTRMQSSSFPTLVKYPPCNVVKENDGTYSVELAVAGFKREELEVSISNNELMITGKHEENNESSAEPRYIYRGLSQRNFLRTFPLTENVDVIGATLDDGILRITLKREEPETPPVRKIAIGTSNQQAISAS